MGIPESRLFCRLDGLTSAVREQQRLLVLTELGLLETESVPIFEEATQTAAHFLDIPICILTLMDQERQWFKSSVGLSRLGLMNDLALSRQMPRDQSLCSYVVDSHQVLAIDDTLTHPAFASSLLVQQYGVRAYLGAPLLTADGQCVGTLAVMALTPRIFTDKDAEFLTLIARLSMSEYERLHMQTTQSQTEKQATSDTIAAPIQLDSTHPTNSVKFALLAQLTQELRTPLTSVMGMASVLNREIYGPLTTKQKEYLDIIHHSGQYLLSLVKEILELSQLDDVTRKLNLSSVDIEMLCQQAISTLEQAVKRREQKIRLSVEPGNRIWLLDKEKIRQMLYHLIFSVIEASNAESLIRLHVSNRNNGLKLTIWASHPCFGDGLTYAETHAPATTSKALVSSDYDSNISDASAAPIGTAIDLAALRVVKLPTIADLAAAESMSVEMLHKNLGLLLSRQLAEMHGGQILIQDVSEPSCRCVILLPRLTQTKDEA